MKLRYIALAAVAAITGQANAAGLDPLAAQVKLYVSGSSAIAPVLAGIFTQNCAADLTVYSSKAGAGSFTADTANGASHNVYTCTVTGSDFGAAYVGKTIAVWKRDAGGSAQGVFPVARNLDVAFLDTTTCDASNLCTGVSNVKPDAGVSDLEPAAFNSAVNRPTNFTGTTAASDYNSSSAVAEVVFGLIVNDRLFNQLVADQGTTTPSISSAAFFSLYSPGYVDSGLGWSPITRANASNQINICSRALGSGSRATAQIQFLQSPNNKFAIAFESPVNNTGTSSSSNDPDTIFISEESSSGNVVTCVEKQEATGATGYAIGLVSADRDLSARKAKFVYLDNQNPNRVDAKEGKYPWVFEAFYQTNKTVRNATADFTNSLTFANAFRDAFKKSSNIAAIPAAAFNGIMAIPAGTNCAAPSSGWTGTTLSACSRVTRGGDSRLPLNFVR